MTTSRRNTIMLWMAYTEFFYPGCELQPGYFYLSIPELYYIPEDGACIGAAGVDAYCTIPWLHKIKDTKDIKRAAAEIKSVAACAFIQLFSLSSVVGGSV